VTGVQTCALPISFSPFHVGTTVAANVISRREIFNKQNRVLG